MSSKNTFFRFYLSVFIVLAICSPILRAQNVRIGTVDQGSAYMIESGVNDQSMRFTEAGATVTANSSSIWNGQIAMDDSGTVSVTGTSSTFTVSGGMSGSGNLTKSGTGIFLLNSESTQTGMVIVSSGTFQAGKNHVLSAESAFSLSGGTLNLNDTTQSIASLSGTGTLKFGSNGTGSLAVGGDDTDTTFSGTFSDQGTLLKTGTKNLVLTGSGTSDTVAFDILAGSLSVNGNFSVMGSSATVRADGTLGGNGILYDVTVEAGGKIAPGTRTGYRVLATDTLTIENDLTLSSGSELSIRVDEAGNSDQIVVKGTYANASGEAKLEIDALAGTYAASETYDRFLVDASGTSLANFGIENISLRQKFLEMTNAAENPDSFQIARIENYFTDRAWTPNQRAVASVLDRTDAARLWRAMTNIANSTNQDEIDDAYHEMTGSVKANSLLLGQWRTSRYGLEHLDLSPCECSGDGTFWLEFVHQTTEIDAHVNSRDYGISRTGVLLGAEERCGDFLVGMLGGYSKPYLYSHGDKYSVGDLQFGFYGGTTFMNRLETKIHIGFGSQSYHSKRYLRNSLLVEEGSAERIEGDFSGNSMSMSFEFAVPFELGMIGIRPLLAFDSDLSWQYRYAETGDTGLELAFNRAFYDRTSIRTGLALRVGSPHECSTISLVGRCYYGYQIGGHSYPVSRGSFVADPTTEMEIFGAELGKDYVDLGVGFRWNVDSCRGFYGNYDYSALRHGTGHTGSIGFMQTW